MRQTIRFGHDGTSDCRRPDDLQQELAKAMKTWGILWDISSGHQNYSFMSFMCHHYVSKCFKMLETILKWFTVIVRIVRTIPGGVMSKCFRMFQWLIFFDREWNHMKPPSTWFTFTSPRSFLICDPWTLQVEAKVAKLSEVLELLLPGASEAICGVAWLILLCGC